MTERYYGRYDSERGWLDRVEDRTTGISMRFVREWNVFADQIPTRMDIEVLKVRIKPRWKRILQASSLFWRHQRTGLGWRASLRLVWLVISWRSK